MVSILTASAVKNPLLMNSRRWRCNVQFTFSFLEGRDWDGKESQSAEGERKNERFNCSALLPAAAVANVTGWKRKST